MQKKKKNIWLFQQLHFILNNLNNTTELVDLFTESINKGSKEERKTGRESFRMKWSYRRSASPLDR